MISRLRILACLWLCVAAGITPRVHAQSVDMLTIEGTVRDAAGKLPLYTCRRILRPGKATHARRISCVCRLPDTGYRRRPYAPRQLQELVGAFPFCSHTYIPGLYTVPDETANPILLNDPTGTTAIDRYTLWARSDARIASMSTFRCRSINVTWSVYTNNTAGIAGSLLKKMHVRNMDITATVNNVFLIADPKWHGMDPDLGGDRKAPRSYTMGLNFGL